MTALLVIPMNRTVIINTDSQAAIHRIDAINSTTSLRSIYKLANNAVLSIIKQLITEKNLVVIFNKVKGHSNNLGNDKADRLAKEVSMDMKNNSLGVIRLDSELGCNMNYGINWKGHLVEGNLRKFNRLVSNGLADSNWSLGSIWDDPRWNDTWTNSRKEQDYVWSIWWSLLCSLNHFNCHSMKTHRLFSFIVKISHYLLPTIDKLRLRSSEYNALSCPGCRISDETQEHMILCPQYQEFWEECEDSVTERLHKLLLHMAPNEDTIIRTRINKLTTLQLKLILFPYLDPTFHDTQDLTRIEL